MGKEHRWQLADDVRSYLVAASYPTSLPKEDVFLVKSWWEISYDPIINTLKKKEGFWARITSQYNKKRGSFPERSFRSLQSRWETIKAEASKFAGHMANVLKDNLSGMSDADKVRETICYWYLVSTTVCFIILTLCTLFADLFSSS